MKRNAKSRPPIPDWALRVDRLRRRLKLSQSALGQQLQYSAMAVSRWERGIQEPPAACYIRLGEMSGLPDCWYFWERAGLKTSDVKRTALAGKSLFPKSSFPDFDIVVPGSGKKAQAKKTQVVAIPLLNVHAGAHGERGDNV